MNTLKKKMYLTRPAASGNKVVVWYAVVLQQEQQTALQQYKIINEMACKIIRSSQCGQQNKNKHF